MGNQRVHVGNTWRFADEQSAGTQMSHHLGQGVVQIGHQVQQVEGQHHVPTGIGLAGGWVGWGWQVGVGIGHDQVQHALYIGRGGFEFLPGNAHHGGRQVGCGVVRRG